MSGSSPAKANRRILVIDDNCAIHEDFRKILGEPDAADAVLLADELAIFGTPHATPFDIDAAAQGEEGLRKVEQSLAEGRPYAVAFVDVRMPPGWDGIETTKRIWQVCPDLQIVICTAYADCSWSEMQEEIEPGDRLLILKKPFDTIEVLQLANALSEKWWLLQESRLKVEDLESLVRHRTAELEESREAALRTMEEAVRHRLEAEQANEDLRKEVAERARLEGQFREQASLLDKARDAIFVRDLGHRITYWNKSAERLYGWTPGEALGSSAAELLHKDPAAFQSACEVLLQTGEWVGELRKTSKGGQNLVIEGHWTLVQDSAGEPKSVLVINTDITARKAAEEALRMQGRVVESMSEGVTVCSDHGVISFSNAACEVMFGYEDREMTGLHISALYQGTPAEGQEIVRQMAEQVQARGMWTGELNGRKKDGTPLIIRTRASVLEFDGKKAFITLFEDITGRKAMEAQFLRSQRMESVGRLSSGIAHDLNNILTPILMAAFMLRQQLPPDELEQALDTIETSTRRGADLIKQLLTFGRGGGKARAVVRPDAIFRDVIKMIESTFPKNIALNSMIPDDCWPVMGDATQLHQLLLNLCVNARDAMTRGGTLTLSMQNVRVDESFASMTPHAKPGPFLLLQVSDTGEGIPPEIIDKIFDPFFTTKETGKGTGIGLSTAMGIIESHHGFLNLRSQVKTGTTFEIYLPAAPGAEEVESVTPPAGTRSGRGELILVVEDEPGIREVTEKTLLGNGYKVVTAGDGMDGIIAYCQHRDDIKAVLTDIVMPSMDGVTMTRILKKMDPSLKIVASSGIGSIGAREQKAAELSSLGVETFLSKPYSAEVILSALGKVFESC